MCLLGSTAIAQGTKKTEDSSKEDDGFRVIDIWEVVQYQNGRAAGRSGVFYDEAGAKAWKERQERFKDPKTGKTEEGEWKIEQSRQKTYVGKGGVGAKSQSMPEENTRPKGGLVTKPGMKTVDPGDINLNSKAKPVAGQKGTGVIGDKKVSITFTGKDGKGTFKLEGELSGEGDWEQSGAGVTFETSLSKFRGVVQGDKLAGVRFTKKPGADGKNALTEWSITFPDGPTPARVSALEGTRWSCEVYDYMARSEQPEVRLTIGTGTYSFETGGKVTYNYHETKSGKDYKSEGTWSQDGENIRITFNGRQYILQYKNSVFSNPDQDKQPKLYESAYKKD
jgi:hypothetical protein